MDRRTPSPAHAQFQAPERSLGDLPADVAARVVAAVSDIAMVVDRNGVIRDVAVNESLQRTGVGGWIDQPLVNTVTSESRHKVEELLRAADGPDAIRWREINHPTDGGEQTPFRYIAVSSGRDDRLIVIGRDLSAAADLQRRLMQAQQGMERDYARLRQAETRYRLLFQIASEPVLIVEAASRRVTEANPAAAEFLGLEESQLLGQPFAKLFSPDSQEEVASFLGAAQAGGRPEPITARLGQRSEECAIAASLFRQERGVHLLVRLSARSGAPAPRVGQEARLLDILEQIPDAFVVADGDLRVLAANAAFLDLIQAPGKDQAVGQALDRFLGRPGVEFSVLISNLRRHGSVRNFATILRGLYASEDDVEVSAVYAPDGDPPCFGFTIRAVGRRLGDLPRMEKELPRSVGQLTDLVGRVPMKEIVRETTDLIERLCIEAALELTGNNRASAAELLGLSRQSLYSKLHRYGVGGGFANEDDARP